MAKNFRQGYYTPVNPEKYVGDPTKICYRSSWELEVHKFFDNNTRVLRWASEELAIPYIKPTDGKLHKYYPDYWVEYITKDGEIIKEVIELKPLSQTRRPRGKASLYEHLTLAVNMAKWQAAEVWCKQHGVKFRIITERSVFK